MPDLATILERESRTVGLEAGAFERVRRLRERRQRNRRIGAAFLALVVAMGALGYAWTVLRREDSHVSIDQITVDNVNTLGTAWSVKAASEFDPEIRGDTVWTIGWGSQVGGSRYVIQSVPLDCNSEPAGCAPRVIATPGPSFNFEKALLIGSTSVYAGGGPDLAGVVGSSGAGSQIPATVTAYPQSCDQQPCPPLWRGSIGPTTNHEWLTPEEEFGNRLFATTTRAPMLVAFDTSCARRICPPVWTSGRVGLPTLAGDIVVARMTTSLSAFDRSCWTERGPLCPPVWTVRLDPARHPLALPQPQIVGDLVLSSDPHGIVAVPIRCPNDCSPRWMAPIAGGSGFPLVVSEGLVIGAAEGGSDLYAFPLACHGRCDPQWTAHVDSGVGFEPTVSGDVVTVTSALAASMSAFPLGCEGTCSPDWVASLPDSVLYRPTAANGLIYVSGTQDLSVFSESCPVSCRPVSIQSLPGGAPVGSAIVQGNTLLVIDSSFEGLAFQPGIGGSLQRPAGDRPSLPVAAITLVVVVVTFGMTFWRRRRVAP
jgi:hypothetical protein